MTIIDLIRDLFETISFRIGWYVAFIWLLEALGLL